VNSELLLTVRLIFLPNEIWIVWFGLSNFGHWTKSQPLNLCIHNVGKDFAVKHNVNRVCFWISWWMDSRIHPNWLENGHATTAINSPLSSGISTYFFTQLCLWPSTLKPVQALSTILPSLRHDTVSDLSVVDFLSYRGTSWVCLADGPSLWLVRLELRVCMAEAASDVYSRHTCFHCTEAYSSLEIWQQCTI